MKFVILLSLMCIGIGYAQQQSEVKCFMDAIPVGECGSRIIGYTYSSVRTRCVNYETIGCEVIGNFFTDRKVCEAKCKPPISFRNNPFSYYVERAYDQARDTLSRILTLPR
ncbi:uncharacterized protein LOC27208683 [Drosophila simulans]|uniref:BPTI/Kunitz inhibitor domain-containing protein n=1 Tax=Drosophila simulans TaxID=7240 RepID=A0A0J9QV71_DROSI|nr:uncharacterized protein LOC27208683 [Drosophila simulans]KMY87938.1 uncharacterized protein Dsimw501_GD28839 [Drosophila simulans]